MTDIKYAYMDELKRMIQYWKNYQFENEKGLFAYIDDMEIEIDSPFALYKLADNFNDVAGEYDYIPQIVKIEYNDLLIVNGGIGIFDTKGGNKYIDWLEDNSKNLQKNIDMEKMLILYGKVPDDILNEILKYA